VQSGGEIDDLPSHTFPTDDGGVDLKCPTEIAISDRREAEFAKFGLIPLIHRKNTDRRFHRSAVAVQAEGVQEQRRGDGVRQPRLAPALHVRVLPVRALPEGHGPRQGRLLLREGAAREVADQLDQRICRRRSEELDGGHQVPQAARRRQDRHHAERGESGVLLWCIPAERHFTPRRER
jgi:type VI secretion system (T6SS) tail sheath-like EvpB family protein